MQGLLRKRVEGWTEAEKQGGPNPQKTLGVEGKRGGAAGRSDAGEAGNLRKALRAVFVGGAWKVHVEAARSR